MSTKEASTVRPHETNPNKESRVLGAAAKRGKLEKDKSSGSQSEHPDARSSIDEVPGIVSTEVEEEDEVEAAPIVKARDPGLPTLEELVKHDLTHLPHRSWCEVCIKARGKEDPHYKKNKSRSNHKPTVAVDYK